MNPAITPSALRSRSRDFLRRRFARFRDINAKYAVPRIPPRGWVRAALVGLLLYLLILLTVFVSNFLSLVT